jgi:1,4-dihydroxy-2-naphthoyl-CoA hydrolase
MSQNAPDPSSWLRLHRTVRFGDTDAAGVMHFHQLLRWCHEAYEESLERYGIPASEVFPTPRWGIPDGSAGGTKTGWPAKSVLASRPRVALPIVHCSADYLRPLFCGDHFIVTLQPELIKPGRFEVSYRFSKAEEEVARGLTRHLAIDAGNRLRCDLPEAILDWLKASEARLSRDQTSRSQIPDPEMA